MSRKLSEASRLKKNATMKRIRDERRKRNVCINQPNSGPVHGRVHKAGRCKVCYDMKG